MVYGMGESGCIVSVHEAYPEGAQQSSWGSQLEYKWGSPKNQGTTQDLGRKGQLMLEVSCQI